MPRFCDWGGRAVLFLLFLGSASGAIHGTVKDSTGAVVPRARVYLLKPPQPVRTVAADSAGRFEFAGAGTGPCAIFSSASGLTGDKQEIPCDRSDPIELVLRPSALAETVVVTAERAELPSSTVASSVSILTADDLGALQALQLFEALRYLPGVEVNQTGRRGGVTGIFVRGADSRYNLVTIDGVKVNDFGGSYNFASLPAEPIETVELVRGPQSALYGSYAIGSAVQVVTASGLDRRDFFTSAEGGDFGTRRFTAGGGGRIGNLGVYGTLSRFDTDGMVANDDSRFENAHLKVDYTLWARHRLRYAFLVNSNESGNPGPFGSDPAVLFPGLDLASRTAERYNIHSFGYDGELGPRVRQRLSGAIYSDRLDFQSGFGPSFTRQSRQAFSSETSVAPARHDLLTFGVEWNGEQFRSTFVTDPNSNPFPLHRNIYGWFLENHFEAGGRFFLNTGLRLEHLRLDAIPADAFGSRPPLPASTVTELHPKLSAAYLLRPGTRLHGSAGTGLRPPDGFELAFTTNPALKPERTTSFDAGLEQSFFGRRVALDVTWFYNRFHDQIITLAQAQAGLSRWLSDNLANSEAAGLESAIYLQVARGLRFRGAYTYLDTAVLGLDRSPKSVQRFFRLGQQLVRRPRHTGSYLVVWQHGRLLVQTGAVLRGRTLDAEPNFGLSAGQFLNPFYTTFDVGAQFEVRRSVAFTTKLRNLLDRTYEESLGFPALGRNFTVGVQWRWTPE
ncbi:MAG: TonB-dependent receptor [Acidobacteria bacterium]|nr:TonB-dependent receptor [Acidobacteriota bacterium]